MSKIEFVYFKPTDSIFQEFENYEIHPCLAIAEDKDGNLIYEQCAHDNPDIAIWCVYGHFLRGGLECISDHKTLVDAELFEKTLPLLPIAQ